MQRDEYLEAISHQIRLGIPVHPLDAIAAINYQEAWKAYRKANTRWARFKRWISAHLKG